MPYKDRAKQNEKQRQFAKANKAYYVAKKQTYREIAKLLVLEYKEKSGCGLCSEKDPACLVFHHKDPKEKSGNIGMALALGWGKEKLLAEIAKCEVLCSNCHMKLHAKERIIAESTRG